MDFYSLSGQETVRYFNSNETFGLNNDVVNANKIKFGENVIVGKGKKSFISKVFSAMKEPMLLILAFSFILAFGVNLGKLFKAGEADFTECFGVLLAIILSVSITLIMEGSSERAFKALNNIYDVIYVKVIRKGKVVDVPQNQVVVGDILLIESGDKIVADGRILECVDLSVDESALTGESQSVDKKHDIIYKKNVPLAERFNMLYSGTFVTKGQAKMIVTAVGNQTEIGNIAGELSSKTEGSSPLQSKLASLGKVITIIGSISAIFVFILSLVRLIINGNFEFYQVQNLFISCIILIVAAVPEGLPTIVAVSLALNMIKLAGHNALIKKMVATETAGAVSIICSDKTGTLTLNKMEVLQVCSNERCNIPKKNLSLILQQNFICNNTSIILEENDGEKRLGSGTECALLSAIKRTFPYLDVQEYRNKMQTEIVTPFSSQLKYMESRIFADGIDRYLIKGAPEKILQKCKLSHGQKAKIERDIKTHQLKARRVLCFAHKDNFSEEYVYDGYCVLADEIRPEVYKAVEDCRNAGIQIKILTGDNLTTAYAVAKELKIAEYERQVVNAQELEELDDVSLKKALSKITVIARSTPLIKLRIVKALKECGEVVAVTGDGINDAPSLRHADVGFAMGKTGNDISRESADVILLDDSFATVVKAISFGRNVYRNIQRFILFQLSVNLSALFFITVCAIFGLETPFNTFQLLWINVIMDGPPALTLGLDATNNSLMNAKPIKRSKSIVSKKMLFRILFNGFTVGIVMLMQYCFNFLGVKEIERDSAVFTLFIMFQLFNAFNCKELGSESIFKGIGKNKIMLITFFCTFMVQVLIVTFAYTLFNVYPLEFISWFKITMLAFSVIALSEIFKLMYRFVKKFRENKGKIKENI